MLYATAPAFALVIACACANAIVITARGVL